LANSFGKIFQTHFLMQKIYAKILFLRFVVIYRIFKYAIYRCGIEIYWRKTLSHGGRNCLGAVHPPICVANLVRIARSCKVFTVCWMIFMVKNKIHV
jgi:hypothetical protein